MAFRQCIRLIYRIYYRLSSRRFGVVWALLIFNLDRFIVSTIRKRDQFGAIFTSYTNYFSGNHCHCNRNP
jgi:hypothetical protein